MTTPHQPAPDGAFVIGGDGFGFGQGLTDAGAASLMLGSVAGLANPLAVFSTIGDTLASLPLEVLNLFSHLIPGIDAFNSVAEAISHITEFFGQIGPMLFSTFSDWLTNSFNWLSQEVQQIFDIVAGFVVTPITSAVGIFKDWWVGLGQAAANTANTIGGILGGIWAGLTGHVSSSSPKSIADVTNAAANISTQSSTGLELGEWNNAVLGIRNNKSIMSGIDETEESTFLMSDLFDGGTNPPSLSATAASVPIAFWRATETATKGFVSWFGKGFTGVTGIFVDIYRMNYTTNKMELVHTSPDQSGFAQTGWTYMVYNIALEADRVLVNAGDVLAIGIRVTGSGTHTIAGKSAPWMPDHPTVVPSRPGATRTGNSDLAFTSITYSGEIPWFGIGIISGDIPVAYASPRSLSISEVGAWSYNIPSWANFIDVVICGAGGGGAGGNPFIGLQGERGSAGTWQAETLVRGVDFPPGVVTLSGINGTGGSGGSPNSPGVAGSATQRSSIVSGKGVMTATGGARGSGTGPSGGLAAGDYTYNGVTYSGGKGGSASAANPGGSGASPGGGGGGGAGGTYGIAWAGGSGGAGRVFFVARQV